jgi:hypothetical protein
MRFTVQYIPLSKIKPDLSGKMTQHIKKIRNLMWDCMYILAVRKNRKDGNYVIISGRDRYEYLLKHTNNKYAPCIVDESKEPPEAKSKFRQLRNRSFLHNVPLINPNRMVPKRWSIVRAFLKEEPRFKHLSRNQQLKVLLLGIRYKRTAILSMKAKVNEMLSE